MLLAALLVDLQLEHVRFKRTDQDVDVAAAAARRSVGTVVRADVVDLRRTAVSQT